MSAPSPSPSTPRGASPYALWVGREESAEDLIALSPVRRLLATLDDSETSLGEGDPLPPLWHWMYFLPEAPMAELGPDGHPARGGFLPPIDLPRRMFAGARVAFPAPLRIGRPARRTSRIMEVTEKNGASGRLVFVTVRHQVEQDGVLCVEETYDGVYRGLSTEAAVAPTPLAAWPELPAGAWSRIVTPDPVLLFRYSALTFNGHRIHYDRRYTTEVEGYPGLIVHGPLTATLLADLPRRHADRPLATFSFRARAPLYDLAPFRTVGLPDGDRISLRAEGPDGQPCMTAEAVLA